MSDRESLERLVDYVLWVATPLQRGRVLAALARKAPLVGFFVRTRPAFERDDRSFWWRLWRLLVVKDLPTDRAVSAALGVREWRPADEPRLWKEYW